MSLITKLAYDNDILDWLGCDSPLRCCWQRDRNARAKPAISYTTGRHALRP